jgi:hypothetical protein
MCRGDYAGDLYLPATERQGAYRSENQQVTNVQFRTD